MSIDNTTSSKLQNIVNTLQNPEQLQNTVTATLFGLLENQNERRLIADSQIMFQLTNLQTTGLNIEQRIQNKTTAINQRFNYPNSNNQSLPNITYTLQDANQTATTIQRIQAELQRLTFQQTNTTNNIQSIRYIISQTRGNKPQTVQQLQQYQTELTTQQQELEKITTDIAEITRVNKLLEELYNLQTIHTATQNSLGNRTNPTQGTRRHELQTIINIMRNTFGLNTPNYIPQLPNQTVNYNQNTTTIDLNPIFTPTTANPQIHYELCDTQTGDPLPKEGNTRTITSSNGEKIQIKGLKIQNNQLLGNNIQIENIQEVSFPITIELTVRGRVQETNTGINIDNYKPITITINPPNLTQAERQTAYDNLNTALGANTIYDRVDTMYTIKNEQRENEVIQNILRENGNKDEVDDIYKKPELKTILLERLRNIPNLIPVIPVNQLITGFRSTMTDLARSGVKPEHLTSINAFTDYLRTDLDKNIEEYLRDQIKQSINNRTNNGINNRDRILATFTEFVTQTKNNTIDNDDHMQVLQSLPHHQPQGAPNSFWQRLIGGQSNKNNYTKFFVGKEERIENQVVPIQEGELKYKLTLSVTEVNKMSVTIDIEGEDEPLIIDAANHHQLLQAILAREANKSGEPLHRKARCHMAISMIKALVKMSPVSLYREFNGIQTDIKGQQHNIDRVEAFIKNDNLILRANSVASHGNRLRQNQVIFDESRYKALHDINQLENGIHALSDQISNIMDSMGDEFTTATSRIKPSPLMRYETNLPLRFGRAKRLYGRIAHGPTNYNFDFTTTVSAGGKTVNIAFENGRFTISGTHHDKPYKITRRNLGRLLRTKRERIRVFDGIELDILAEVNEQMIKKLQTNSFIRGENFAVTDLNPNKTGRVYILDSQGHLSYLEIEDRNLNPIDGGEYGRIQDQNLPPQRIRCNDKQRRDFMQNPLLAGRLLRAMRLQLALF